MKSVKLAISLALLAAAIGIVAWNLDLSEALVSARNLSLFGLAAVFLALIVNALTAALRFKIIASDVATILVSGKPSLP